MPLLVRGFSLTCLGLSDGNVRVCPAHRTLTRGPVEGMGPHEETPEVRGARRSCLCLKSCVAFRSYLASLSRPVASLVEGG